MEAWYQRMRRRPKILCIATFFGLCTVTAFVYYLLLVWTVENDKGLYSPVAKIRQEIHGKLNALESELRENQQLLTKVRLKVDQVSKSVFQTKGGLGPKKSTLNDMCSGTMG